jgi:glycerate kinase
MKIVIAPDKFKDCLAADGVARAMAAGIDAGRPALERDVCPVSDGGEGFVAAMSQACGGRLVTRRVTGPRADMKVNATFAVLPDQTAVIEMSSASGIELLDIEDRNPELTTTFGTGELLLAAVDEGCRKIILGIGGSATIDGGIGCCHAAGLPVLLDDGEPTSLTEPLCGGDLLRVARIKSHRGDKLTGVEIVVACDVNNPLYGPNGAARMFGRQKGATDAQIEQFDQNLKQLALRCGMDDIAHRPGAGAAGGLGFGMMAFFGATMQPGAQLVIEATHLRDRLRNADLCITGEGRFDASSLAGKAPVRIAELCRELGVPCIAICGDVDRSVASPFAAMHSLRSRAKDEHNAIHRAEKLIKEITQSIVEQMK